MKLRVFNIFAWGKEVDDLTNDVAFKGLVYETKGSCWRCGIGLIESELGVGYCKLCIKKEYLRVLELLGG